MTFDESSSELKILTKQPSDQRSYIIQVIGTLNSKVVKRQDSITLKVQVKDPCPGIKITPSQINSTNYTIGYGDVYVQFEDWSLSTDLCGNLTYSASE